MPKPVDGQLRELLEAAELLLEYGTPEDRYRVSSVFHAVLGAGATSTTVKWGVDYLQAKLAEPARVRRGIPLPDSADVPRSVRDADEQGGG